MSISITGAEKARLKASGTFIVLPLLGSTGSGQALYHNPVTGQELKLPGAPDDVAWYIRKGFRPGPAPATPPRSSRNAATDDPKYRNKQLRTINGDVDIIQRLEQRLAALEGSKPTYKPEPDTTDEQLPLF